MSASYLCPKCGKAVTVRKLPVEKCPHCGAELPEALVDEIEQQFKPVRPISLTCEMWLGFIVGFFMLIVLPASFQPVDDSLYVSLGMPPIPHLPPFLAGLLATVKTVFLLWTSYSLYRNEFRSRALLMIMVFVFTVPETALMAPLLAGSQLGKFIFLFSAVIALLTLVLAYLYLYLWKYCVAYYDSLLYLEQRGPHRADRRV